MKSHALILTASLLVPACTGVVPPPPPTAPTDIAASTVPARVSLTASSDFSAPLAVAAQVLSADGHALPNVPVAFSIGAGDITPQTTSTDASGVARASATVPGTTTISAAIGRGIGSSITVLASQPEAAAFGGPQ
jgi:hypothetical protein